MVLKSIIELHGSRQTCAKSITGPSRHKRLKNQESDETDRCPPSPGKISSSALRAMTADVERQLKQLVAKFGEKKVREVLDPLITNVNGTIGNAVRMRSGV